MPLKLNPEEPPTINLTSMIDILFLLIIFFMVGTKFTESESNIQINLPKVAPNGAMLPSPSSKTVYLTTDGAIRIDGQQVNQEQLTNLLAQAVRNFPDTTVQIKLDGSIPFQQAADIASAVHRSGAKLNGVALATYQMPGPRR